MPDLAAACLPYLMLVIGLVAAHGANARVARLTKDEIAKPVRAAIIARLRRGHPVSKLVQCPWCFGFWTAWPVTALAWFPIMGLRYWWIYFLVAGSVAHAAGRLNHHHGATNSGE